AGGLIPVALMHVGKAITRAIKNPIADAPDCAWRARWIGRETPVFCLQSDNAIHISRKFTAKWRKGKAPEKRYFFGRAEILPCGRCDGFSDVFWFRYG